MRHLAAILAAAIGLAACSAGATGPSPARTSDADMASAGAGSGPTASAAGSIAVPTAAATGSQPPTGAPTGAPPAANDACLLAAPLSLVRDTLGDPAIVLDHVAGTPPAGFPSGPGYLWSFCLFTAPSGPAGGELAVIVGSYPDATVVRNLFDQLRAADGGLPVEDVGDAAFDAAARGELGAIQGTRFVDLGAANLALSGDALKAAEVTIATAALASS